MFKRKFKVVILLVITILLFQVETVYAYNSFDNVEKLDDSDLLFKDEIKKDKIILDVFNLYGFKTYEKIKNYYSKKTGSKSLFTLNNHFKSFHYSLNEVPLSNKEMQYIAIDEIIKLVNSFSFYERAILQNTDIFLSDYKPFLLDNDGTILNGIYENKDNNIYLFIGLSEEDLNKLKIETKEDYALYIRTLLTHEVGHIIHNRFEELQGDDFWDKYLDIIDIDEKYFGNSWRMNIKEDFAENYVIYKEVRDKKRTIFPYPDNFDEIFNLI